MIPLATSAPEAAALPASYGGVTTLIVGSIVVLVLVGFKLLREMQAGRAALVAEIKKELGTKAEPQAMSLPQPFTVQPHTEYVTTTAHDKDIKEIKEELKRHAGRRAEIYETQKEQGEQLAALVAKSDAMNATQIRQEGKIDIILQRLPRTLN